MAKPLQQDSEGRIMNDTETAKSQKGYANYEKDQREAQKKLDTEDAKFKETIKQGVEKVRGVLGMKKGGKVAGKLATRGYGKAR